MDFVGSILVWSLDFIFILGELGVEGTGYAAWVVYALVRHVFLGGELADLVGQCCGIRSCESCQDGFERWDRCENGPSVSSDSRTFASRADERSCDGHDTYVEDNARIKLSRYCCDRKTD